MKKVWFYGLLVVFELAWGLAFGFGLKDIMPVDLCLLVAFSVPVVVLLIFTKNKRVGAVDIIEIAFSSLLLMSVFIGVFSYGNRLCGKFVDEYDVIVEFVDGRGGGYADFTTPQGNEGSVELHDYRPIIVDDDYVDVGDTIRVREYKGLFDEMYYVYVAEVR